MEEGSKFDYFKISVMRGMIRLWWWDAYGRHNDRRLKQGESAFLEGDVQSYGAIEAHTECNPTGEPAEVLVNLCRFESVKNGGLTVFVEKSVV